jgi:hypothetical protein
MSLWVNACRLVNLLLPQQRKLPTFYENKVNRRVFLMKIMQERHNFFSPSKVEAVRQRAKEIEAKKEQEKIEKAERRTEKAIE